MGHKELYSKIEALEREIKDNLELSKLMYHVRFHSKENYLALQYNVFNHEEIRRIIERCCKETLEIIARDNTEIEDIENLEMPSEVHVKRIRINSKNKNDKSHASYRILCDLKKCIDNYFLRHANEIDKYRELIEKRLGKKKATKKQPEKY